MIADRVILVCILVLTVVYFYATQQIPSLEIGDPLGPKAFPRLLGIGLLVTAGLLFLEMWRAGKNGTKESTPQKAEDRGHFKVVGGVVVWTGIYLAVFEPLGYVISTAVYLSALTAYFNRGKWVANLLTAVLFSVLTYLMFQALGVSLPKGVLPF